MGNLSGRGGVLVVGMSDNVIKPILIGKSSDMPLILVVLGILVGVAFLLPRRFIGPTLLAVSYTACCTIGRSVRRLRAPLRLT